MSSSDELKCCPFCGCEAIKKYTGMGEQHFQCLNRECGAVVRFDGYFKKGCTPADQWNNRFMDYDTIDTVSQFLKNAGFDEASEAVICEYEI